MNLVSRTITGIVLILGGIGIIIASFFSTLILLVHAVIVFIVGLFILFNKKEDEIEKIKSNGGKK